MILNKIQKGKLRIMRIAALTFFLSLLILFLPSTSSANSFSGLGIIVYGMLIGIPSAAILIILIVLSLVFLKTSTLSTTFKQAYQIIGIILTSLAMILYPIFAMIGEKKGFFLLFLFCLPLLILGIISFILIFQF